MGKGGRGRAAPFAVNTAEALRRAPEDAVGICSPTAEDSCSEKVVLTHSGHRDMSASGAPGTPGSNIWIITYFVLDVADALVSGRRQRERSHVGSWGGAAGRRSLGTASALPTAGPEKLIGRIGPRRRAPHIGLHRSRLRGQCFGHRFAAARPWGAVDRAPSRYAYRLADRVEGAWLARGIGLRILPCNVDRPTKANRPGDVGALSARKCLRRPAPLCRIDSPLENRC